MSDVLTLQEVVIVRDPSGEWEAAYVNGKLVDQGHSVQLDEILEALDIPLRKWTVATDDIYPDNLLDIRKP